MDLHYLQEFIILERVRNYTRAADAIYTTEATLSRHIKQMEKELGRPLFTRTTRSVELTEFGMKYLSYAKRIVEIMEECDRELRWDVVGDTERLMIGVFGPISNYSILQYALHLLSTNHPEYVVGTVLGDINELKYKLSKSEHNVAIVREGSDSYDDKFERLSILKEPLYVVIPIDDPLAKEETVDISMLENRSITLPSEYMLAHKLFLEQCRLCGFEPSTKFLLKEREFVQNFTSVGSGIFIMSQSMAERSHNPATQIAREISPPIYEYINLLYIKSSNLQETTRNTIRCFEEALYTAPEE